MSSPSTGPSSTAAENPSSYLDELRRFSATNAVPYGSPEHLQVLCDRLAHDPAFLVEFQSMVRSILYRENFRITPAGLLSLVGQTWGGPAMPDLNGPLYPPTCDLAAFLRDAMKLPRLEGAGPEETTDTADIQPPMDDQPTRFDELSSFAAPQLHAPYPAAAAGLPPQLAAATTAPHTPPSTPWWAEPATTSAFTKPAPAPDFLPQTELVTSTETTPLTNDPWQTNSTFHQELLRFAARRG